MGTAAKGAECLSGFPPHPKADIELVRQWVREFVTAMSMSDIVDDFEKVLARRKPENQ